MYKFTILAALLFVSLGLTSSFAIASMLTLPLSIDNSFWGYAQATTEPNSNIPQPIDFLYFDIWNFHDNGGTIVLDDDNSAILLDGIDDYIVFDSNLSEKLEQFTVSVWIKPDYKKGAPAALSVVSEADAFALSINNDKINKNVAVFSVYDGIKWHQVQSQSAILEQWTHISATYNENQIKIFVNGIRENSQTIDGEYSLTHQYGVSTQNSHDYISSQSDVLVGAFNPLVRDASSLHNHFSGLIDDVTLYDSLLTTSQISSLDEIDRTPDTITAHEVQQIETVVPTGTANEYGFVTDDDNPNDQKIEEVAAEGYKVKKPEDTKKKDKVITQETPKVTEEPAEQIITEFDESTILIATSSTTTVCHIPPGNHAKNKTLTIGESALDAHIGHGDAVPTCQAWGWNLPLVLERKAPQSVETVEGDSALATQLIRVSSETGSTFSDLPQINSRAQYQWKLYGDLDGEIINLTHDTNVNLQLLDLNSDNRLDRAEWSTTDGITEYYLVAQIILATDGLHLDSDRDYVDDIFYETIEKDGIWTYEISDGDFVRVTFEQPLDDTRYITVHAKSSGAASINVYEKDGAETIATFTGISSEGSQTIFLTTLSSSQQVFDLEIVGAPIQFDLIIDPLKINIYQCHNWNGSHIIDCNGEAWGIDNAQLSNDFDGDGITYFDEIYTYFTHPLVDDTDNDGLIDGVEINVVGTNATDGDTDDDGITDGNEDINADGVVDPTETNPFALDTDSDGLQDGTEIGLSVAQSDGTDLLVFIPDADAGATTTIPYAANSDGDTCVLDGTDEDYNLNGKPDGLETRDPSEADCF